MNRSTSEIIYTKRKAIYYRAKPFAISNQIYGECACDPGMPSGHADAAAMAYIILYLVVYPKNVAATKEEKFSMAFLLMIFCGAMTIFIMLALIYTGQNTFSQVIIGVMVAVATASLITFRIWLKGLYAIRNHIKKIAALTLLVLMLYTLGMLFINSYGRENPSYWQFFHEQCPHCHDSWVYDQTRALAAIYFLPIYYFFFPFVQSSSVLSPRATARQSVVGNQAQPVAVPQSVIHPGLIHVLPIGLADSNCPQPEVQINPYMNPTSVRYQPQQPSQPNPPEQIPEQPFVNMAQYQPHFQAQNEPHSLSYYGHRSHHESQYSHQEPQYSHQEPHNNGQQQPISNPESQNLRANPEQSQARPERREFTRYEQWARYGWLFVICFPAIILLLIFFFAIQHQLLRSTTSVQTQSIVAWIFYGLIFTYLGWGCTYLKDLAFTRNKLLSYNDRIYFDDLKQRLDALQPPIVR